MSGDFRVETIYPSPFATTRVHSRYRARCALCPWTGKRWEHFQRACDEAGRHLSAPSEVHELAERIRGEMRDGALDPDIADAMLLALARGSSNGYEELWREVMIVDPPGTLFHTAPVSARAEILTHGLIVEGRPPGISCSGEPDWAGRFARPGHPWDVWAIERGDLPWMHDLRTPASWVVLTDVPVSALRREAPWQ